MHLVGLLLVATACRAIRRHARQIARQAVRSRRDAAITRRLDELFADPAVAEDQLRTARDLDRVGTDWSDDGW